MASFSIKDLANFCGIKAHTIRIWEQRYSFLRPNRTPSFQRTYTPEELSVLLNVVLLNQNGYKISLIDKMTLEEKLQAASRIAEQQQKAIHQLIIGMTRMDAQHFETVLDSCIISCGIHETIMQILLPFCERTGLFQEEYAKNYLENIIVVNESIKRKLYLGMEKAEWTKLKSKKAILFLGANHQGELRLLCLEYLLKMAGFETLNLGQFVSVKSLTLIVQHVKPEYIVSLLANKPTYSELVNFVRFLPDIHAGAAFISIEHELSFNGPVGTHYQNAATFYDAFESIVKNNIGE